jgi:NAD(P)-dependent dehydrogenase (short-subunit alcohol dehydrogenase family)
MTTEPHVLVTGAGKRIGRAIALDLGLRGWKVSVHYGNSASEAEEVVDEINRRTGGLIRAAAIQADLSHEKETGALIGKSIAALGPLTALVNNASVFHEDTLGEMTRQSWNQHIETNLRAPILLSQGFAKQLPKEAHGSIINLLDQRVWRLTPIFFSYTISKAALWAATQTMAQALGPRIRVNGVGPGPTLQGPHQDPDTFARQQKSTILGLGPTPEDICAAVRYLLAAPAVTGQMIAVDGGQHLGWRTPDAEGSGVR